MSEILVIGPGEYRYADSITWYNNFPNISEYDILIVDIQSFPTLIYEKLGENIEKLFKGIWDFLKTGREVYCIIDDPKPLERHPNMNYSYFPFFNQLILTRTEPGTSKKNIQRFFEKYFEYVEEWHHILTWENTNNITYRNICVNKTGDTIALTYQFSNLKGAIHLLPKTTKIDTIKSIVLLIDIILGADITEHPWRSDILIPGLNEKENNIEAQRKYLSEIEDKICDLIDEKTEIEKYRDAFSKNTNKVPVAVQKMLSDIGIDVQLTPKGYVVDLLNSNIAIEVTSVKGKVNAKTKKINQLTRFHEEVRKKETLILIANTHNELPLHERSGKENITKTMNKFLVAINTGFMTCYTLYTLWRKVMERDMKKAEAKKLILSSKGQLII